MELSLVIDTHAITIGACILGIFAAPWLIGIVIRVLKWNVDTVLRAMFGFSKERIDQLQEIDYVAIAVSSGLILLIASLIIGGIVHAVFPALL